MRRWSLRILLGVLILLLLAAAGVQAILWSDFPRARLAAQLQRQLGLRVDVKSVSVGWFGSSVLRQVTLALPLADEALLNVPRLEVDHAWLASMIVGAPLDLRAMRFSDPELLIRQDTGGRWNVQDALELLARASGAEPGDVDSPSAAMPRISVVNGVVRIIDRANREAVVQSVAFSGHGAQPLLWNYELQAGTQLHATGQVVPGGTWKHQLRIVARQIDPWIKDWIQPWPDNAIIEADWSGQFEENHAIAGRLQIVRSQFSIYSASGALAVRGHPAALQIRPESLLISGGGPLLAEIRTTGGSALLAGSTIQTQGLRLAVGQGMLDIDGQWNFFTGDASLAADWENIELPAGVRHSGSMEGAVAQPWPDQLRLDLNLRAHGSALGGDFSSDLKISGDGAGWDEMNLQLSAPRLAWQGTRLIEFNDVLASITTRQQTIALNDVRAVAQGRLAGNGAVDLSSGDWRLWIDAGGWSLPRANDATVNFMVDAWGNSQKIRLKQLYLSSADVDAVIDGWYVYALPKPLDVDVYLTHLPEVGPDQPGRLVRGKLLGQGHLNGTVAPLDLSANGTLFGRNVFIRERPLGDIAIILAGTIDRDEAQFESQELALLGGRWRVRGYQPFAERSTRLTLEVQDLPLGEISDLMETTDYSGTLDGRCIIEATQWSRHQIAVDGSFELADLRAANFAADSVEGKLSMQNGVLRVDPIVMRRGESGSAEGRLSINVDEHRRVQATLAATTWPMQLDRAALAGVLTGDADLDIDFSRGSLFGPFNVEADVTRGDNQPLGRARLAAQFTDRIIDIQRFDAEALGGRLEASATFDRDHPLESIAQARWNDLSGQELARLFPIADGLTGSFSGAAKISPARDWRALEPLRLHMMVESRDAALRGAALGNAEINAYLNTDRLVLDRSTLLFADGTVEVWLRTSRRPDSPTFTQLILRCDRLDLNQLVHMGAPNADPMPGRIAGNFTLVGDPRRLENTFGDGDVFITESDLVNSDVIAALYGAMNIGTRIGELSGNGSATLHLENSTLAIQQLRYFNRGTEVRADITLNDMWKLPDNPMSGFAVGSARPLKDVKLPFLADVDEIFHALQKDLTPVRIGGTVRYPRAELAPFSEIGDAMRRFLFGDVKHDTLEN